MVAKDRISALPDEVLLFILSLLSLKEAVATSVLAKRWRYLWHSLDTFDFSLNGYGSPDECREKYLHFRQSVYKVLNAGDPHRSIQKFRFQCSTPYLDATDFNTWINTIIQRRIENFEVTLYSQDPWPSKPFVTLTSCRNLVHLTLRCLVLKLPTSVHFPSLKTLLLLKVTFDDLGILTDLLSGSQLLEVLGLTLLKYNVLNVRPYKTLPKLVKVWGNVAHVPLKVVTNVEFLRLNWTYEARASHKEMDVFPNLTHFSFTYIELTSKTNDSWIEFVVEVLKHSPKLQFLSIRKLVKNDDALLDFDEKEWTYPQIVPECISSHLKTCHIQKYIGSKGEFQLASYIIENAACLQSMSVRTPPIEDSEKLEMLKKLSMCTRRSSSCRLSFESCVVRSETN